MKWRMYFLAALMAAFVAAGCGDDDNNFTADDVPSMVMTTFRTMYPNEVAHWESERGKIKAEFMVDGDEVEVWFDKDGTWISTETDYKGALPTAVQTYINTNYPGYTIDDVDWIETPTLDYFDIELEKDGSPDVRLLIQQDGTLVNGSADNILTANDVPTAVMATFNAMYPNTNAEWESEHGKVKAEFEVNGQDVEVWFEKDGTWVRTESEYRGALPTVVQNYISANYAGYKVDDIDWVETLAMNYFDIELDKPSRPDVHLLIQEDGTLVNVDVEGDITTGDVPTAVMATFNTMYPNTRAEWETEYGKIKAEFEVNGRDVEVWFETDGTWIRTETEYRGALPAAVQNYINANYAGYTVDDVDWIETPTMNYFDIELEKLASPDVRLLIQEDGTPVG